MRGRWRGGERLGQERGSCRQLGGRARGRGCSGSGPSLRVSNERRLRSLGRSWASRIGVSRCLEGSRAPDAFWSPTLHSTKGTRAVGPVAWAALTGSASGRRPGLQAAGCSARLEQGQSCWAKAACFCPQPPGHRWERNEGRQTLLMVEGGVLDWGKDRSRSPNLI